MLSIRHSFLFIHRGKTGGNSISEALLPYCDDVKVVSGSQDGVERFDVENPVYGTRKHFVLRQYAEALPPELFGRLFRFSILRNPFDRLVSAYFSPHRIAKGVVTGFDRESFRALILAQKTMREFVCLSADGPLDRDLQALIRFEHMDRDFRAVTRAIGLGELSLPHRNRSERQSYRAYYDEDLRALVESRFQEELAFGGYRF